MFFAWFSTIPLRCYCLICTSLIRCNNVATDTTSEKDRIEKEIKRKLMYIHIENNEELKRKFKDNLKLQIR